MDATIDDPFFGGLWETRRHVAIRFFNDSLFATITQRERTRTIVGVLNATVYVMQKLDLPVFLDSGTLIGWFRHNGSVIPWDTDGDVGMLTEECLRKYPDQYALERKIRELLPPPYELEYWNCSSRPDLGRDFIGYVSDSRNGFKVDVFGYSTVDASSDKFSWRKKGSWLQRDLDRNYTHRVIPQDAILPFRWGNFSGVTGDILPNDSKRVLQWDYGFVIDPPIFPHGLCMKVVLSPGTLFVFLILCLSSFKLGLVVKAFISLFLLGGGLRVIALVLCLASHRKKSGDLLVSGLRLLCFLTLLSEFHPLVPQVFAACMEFFGVPAFTVNHERYCLFYKFLCVDM